MAIHEKRHRLAAKEGTLKHIMLNKKEKKKHSSVLFVSCIPRKWMSGVGFNKGYPDRWLTDMIQGSLSGDIVSHWLTDRMTGWHFAMLSRLQWGPINIIALTFLRRRDKLLHFFALRGKSCKTTAVFAMLQFKADGSVMVAPVWTITCALCWGFKALYVSLCRCTLFLFRVLLFYWKLFPPKIGFKGNV